MDKTTSLSIEQSFSITKEPLSLKRAERRVLTLFHAAAVRVPAYRSFLKREKINPRAIKTITDFVQLPITDAKNYIAAYPIAARCWDGKLPSAQFIATSSGTTGEPKYWPRSIDQDREAAIVHEFLFREYFQIEKRSTLLLIGFPMGIYISGIATLLPSWLTAFKRYNMTIMSVGNNKKELLRAVQNLSDSYDQTILIGHPFFIKDVIETGIAEGISWQKKNLGLMFCSEGFPEVWREYIAQKVGMPKNTKRIFNTYGSSEMLLMAYETPFTVKLKERAEKDSLFLSKITSDPIVPQFFQYNPSLRYIESVNQELIFSSYSGIPLIRFDLHDRGEVYDINTINSAMGEKAKYPWPVVSLWGRSDDTIKFHGVNIYPEHIKAGLAQKRFIDLLTGKFVIIKFLKAGLDQGWAINMELSAGVKPSKKLAEDIRAQVTKTLQKINLEYFDMSTHVKKDVRPKILLWPYQHLKYFKPGLKPKYIEKITLK